MEDKPFQENMNKDHESALPTNKNSDSNKERRDFVQSQYERLWDGVRQKYEEVILEGETDLSRIHLFLRRNFGPGFSDEHLRKKYLDHEKKLLETGFICDRQLVRVINMDPRIVTLITDAVKMREAIGVFGPNVGRIIELGAGWGKNLFNLFKFGAPLNAEYWGLELTQAGRSLMERIANRAVPSMTVRSAPFDYYNVDFSMFSNIVSTCVFTHHSIEQMPDVPLQLFERILAIPGFRCCLHFEPCGFQIPGNKWLDNPGQTSFMVQIDESNKRFAEKRNQNKNLYSRLRQLEVMGRIKIHTIRKNFTSHLINNATTMVVWGPPEGEGNLGITEYRDDFLS